MARQVIFIEEFSICNAGDMANEILNALQGGQDVELDLSAIEKIDSAAMQVLMAAFAEAKQLCVRLTCIVPEAVRDYASSIGMPL